MNLERAKQVVLDALVEDMVSRLLDENDDCRRAIALHGFRGFARMALSEQVEDVYDRGLQEANDEVNEACEVIAKWLRVD